MAQVQFDEGALQGKATLLPVEEPKVIDGIAKNVKIKYLSEVTGCSYEVSKTGKSDYIKLTLSIDDKDLGRVNIDHILSMHPKAQKITAQVISLFGCDPRKFDTDELLSRFVFIYIRHEEFTAASPNPITGVPDQIWSNKVERFISLPTPEELKAYVPTAAATEKVPF